MEKGKQSSKWPGFLISYPETDQLIDWRLIFPDSPQIGVFLEGGDIIIDVQNINPHTPRCLFPTPIPGDDCQCVALCGLIVQTAN